MKTAMIFNVVPEKIEYRVFDGDLRKFQDVFVNEMDGDEELQNELNELVYEGDNKPVTLEEFAQAIRDGAFLIECGFLS